MPDPVRPIRMASAPSDEPGADPEGATLASHGGPAGDQPDPLLLALARYVQALDRRYPGGPEQMRREGLDARANMPTVLHPEGPAA